MAREWRGNGLSVNGLQTALIYLQTIDRRRTFVLSKRNTEGGAKNESQPEEMRKSKFHQFNFDHKMGTNSMKCWLFYIHQPGKAYPVWYSTAYSLEDAKKHFVQHKPAYCLEGEAMRGGGMPRPTGQVKIRSAEDLL